MLIDAAVHFPAMLGACLSGSASLQTLSGAERLLWEASERALRQPKGRMVLVLHLSRLAKPAPRAHHIRVARVLLQDSASRFGGQVFSMRNQDLVLLCSGQGEARAGTQQRVLSQTPAEPAEKPETLPSTLARLFAADVPNPAHLTSLWHLASDASELLAYLGERASAPVSIESKCPEVTDGAVSLTALQTILSRAPLADLMVQQTGMSLDPDRSRSLADRLAPSFRELELSLSALNLGPSVSQATNDPYLLRYLASGLDARVIQLLADDLSSGGSLTRPSARSGLPIHIALGLDAILSPAFARLSRRAADAGIRFAAAVSIMQACADLDLMEHARNVLKLTGGELVLTQLDAAVLDMIGPAVLQPDILKLSWSPALLETITRGDLSEPHTPATACAVRDGGRLLFKGVDPTRIILRDVDSQIALAWGHSHGITRFQGPFLDQVQAAVRMASCDGSAMCSLRQCAKRGGSASLPGRTGCTNPALLESDFEAKSLPSFARALEAARR